ncbi:tetratricopeptide repeat-containing sensor histidine kinase [Salinimicrobium marinum]|uniref:tetratricopeptide repeat-containing sensor histidine kinase n=1 Tax=Salinimicrobium marinum TaxID=680283 RepID=UPI0016772FDB|nr:tetratricopeptide repeat-containing sensor histidine kinase [Salinimicrobium marinum]
MDLRQAIFVLFLSFLFLSACSEQTTLTDEKPFEEQIDSILNSEEIPEISKVDSLEKILDLVQTDTLRNKLLWDLSYFYSRTDDSESFKNWNSKSRSLSIRLNDTSKIADSYWDAGHFYYHQNVPDSAYAQYSRAYDIYMRLNRPTTAARLMLNMAITQKNIKDYTGSEISTTKVIQLLKDSGENRRLYSAHNNLGIVYNGLKEFDKSLKHYDLALGYLEKLEDQRDFKLTTLNNQGVLLQSMGDHQEAMNKFNTALSRENLFSDNPQLYAMLLDNKTYSKLLLLDTVEIVKDFNRALHIRDSIGHEDGVVINQIHLSQYYALKGDTLKAIELTKEANILARQTSNNRDVLASLKLLSTYDQKNSGEHLSSYIRLSDSLQQQERNIRNKFTKIRFDTDEFIAENEKLYGQRNVLVGLSLGIALLGLSGFVIKNQGTKNRELSLKQEQQEANEKIFQLLLDQQNIKEATRQRERIRLSEELHDGILSKFFGLRISLESLNSNNDKKSIIQREKYLEDLKVLGQEIRQLSHELNSPLFTSGTGYLSILEEVLSLNETSLTYKIEVEEEIQWEKIPGSIKLHFLRILQEALKNSQTHSEASLIKVSFVLKQGVLSYTIQDNGKGFKTQIKNEGIGLKNMASRTKAMKGKIKIESQINRGTKIKIQVPV